MTWVLASTDDVAQHYHLDVPIVGGMAYRSRLTIPHDVTQQAQMSAGIASAQEPFVTRATQMLPNKDARVIVSGGVPPDLPGIPLRPRTR